MRKYIFQMYIFLFIIITIVLIMIFKPPEVINLLHGISKTINNIDRENIPKVFPFFFIALVLFTLCFFLSEINNFIRFFINEKYYFPINKNKYYVLIFGSCMLLFFSSSIVYSCIALILFISVFIYLELNDRIQNKYVISDWKKPEKNCYTINKQYISNGWVMKNCNGKIFAYSDRINSLLETKNWEIKIADNTTVENTLLYFFQNQTGDSRSWVSNYYNDSSFTLKEDLRISKDSVILSKNHTYNNSILSEYLGYTLLNKKKKFHQKILEYFYKKDGEEYTLESIEDNNNFLYLHLSLLCITSDDQLLIQNPLLYKEFITQKWISPVSKHARYKKKIDGMIFGEYIKGEMNYYFSRDYKTKTKVVSPIKLIGYSRDILKGGNTGVHGLCYLKIDSTKISYNKNTVNKIEFLDLSGNIDEKISKINAYTSQFNFSNELVIGLYFLKQFYSKNSEYVH